MEEAVFLKCPCRFCGVNIEFPATALGCEVQCPSCEGKTILHKRQIEEPAPAKTQWSPEDVAMAFDGALHPPATSSIYKIGLALASIVMVLLPLVYIAFVGCLAWAVFHWAVGYYHLLRWGTAGFFIFMTPLFIGSVLVLFMIKPLFAKRAPVPQPLALNYEAEPVLLEFIAQICSRVGASFPKRVDLNCDLNASAAFDRGLRGFLKNELVLTIGLPLAAGLTVEQFAGVLAHEFGHFRQGFGMRLHYLIWRINDWFERIIYMRDHLDAALDESAEAPEGNVAIMVGFARLGVWFSRQILKLLMYTGHAISSFSSRQMEFDADAYEIRMVGSANFETTGKRFHVLGALLKPVYKEIRASWNLNKHLPENFPAFLVERHARLAPEKISALEDSMGLKPTGMFDTHPSYGDRIRWARQANERGIFHLDGPASKLFSNFEVISKQISLIHYQDDLGVELRMARLKPVEVQTA